MEEGLIIEVEPIAIERHSASASFSRVCMNYVDVLVTLTSLIEVAFVALVLPMNPGCDGTGGDHRFVAWLVGSEVNSYKSDLLLKFHSKSKMKMLLAPHASFFLSSHSSPAFCPVGIDP